MNDVTARLASPHSLPPDSGKPQPPSPLDLGGASRRTAGLSPSEAREKKRSDLDGPRRRRHHHPGPGGRARPARALGSHFGRFGRTSFAPKSGGRHADVDHMRPTSNPPQPTVVHNATAHKGVKRQCALAPKAAVREPAHRSHVAPTLPMQIGDCARHCASPAFGDRQGGRGSSLVCAHTREDADVMGDDRSFPGFRQDQGHRAIAACGGLHRHAGPASCMRTARGSDQALDRELTAVSHEPPGASWLACRRSCFCSGSTTKEAAAPTSWLVGRRWGSKFGAETDDAEIALWRA